MNLGRLAGLLLRDLPGGWAGCGALHGLARRRCPLIKQQRPSKASRRRWSPPVASATNSHNRAPIMTPSLLPVAP